MNTYAERKKTVSLPRADAPAQEKIQPQLNSMQNIDVHSGHSLHLEDSLKSRIEQHLGYDLSGVELRESQDAADIGAEAFAKGNTVHFAPGSFDQRSQRGQHLIAHELSHVVQQAKGGVRADVGGLNVNASEALEGAADRSGDAFIAGGGSTMSAPLAQLPAMDAGSAPIQGSFFGGIKNFFKKMKNSYNFGKALKGKENVVSSITAEHAAEESDMLAAMKSQGFSDEEIEAQKLFQRLNMSDKRGERFGDAIGDILDAGGNLSDPSQMGSFAARLGSGHLTKKGQAAAMQREDNFRNNIIAARPEMDRADALTASIGAKYAAMDKARANLAHMQSDGRSREGDDYFDRRTAAGKSGAMQDSHLFRLFLRQSYGKTDEEKDEMYDLYTNAARKGEFLDHVRGLVNDTMNMDMDQFNTPDEADMLERSNAINDKTTDVMALSDIVKDHAGELGYSNDFITKDFGSRRQYLMAVKNDIRGRQREIAGESEKGSTAKSETAKLLFGESGKNQGFASFRNRYIADKRREEIQQHADNALAAISGNKNGVMDDYNKQAMAQFAGATAEQNAAGKAYIADSRDLNGYLRSGQAPTGKQAELDTMKQNLEGRMGSLENDQMGYRSISDVGLLPIIEQLGLQDQVIKANGMIDHEALMKNRSKFRGMVFQDNAFVSTTAIPDFAEKWGAGLARRDRGVFADRALQRHQFTDADRSLPHFQDDLNFYNDKSLPVRYHNQAANALADRVLTGENAVKESDIGTHMMEIMMPKGTKASFLDAASTSTGQLGEDTKHNQQFEMLLNHGSHFRIADIVNKRGQDGKSIPNQFRIILELLKEEEEERR